MAEELLTENSLRSLRAERIRPVSSSSAHSLPVPITELVKLHGPLSTTLSGRVTVEKERIIDKTQIDVGEGSDRTSDMLSSGFLSLISSEIERWNMAIWQ